MAIAIAVAAQGVLGPETAGAERPAPVGAHRHYIEMGGEKVYVGPNFCDIEAAAQGFAGFHHKVHLTDPGLVDVKFEVCAVD